MQDAYYSISDCPSLLFQEPIKSRAPQLHLEYRFYKQLGNSGKTCILFILCLGVRPLEAYLQFLHIIVSL